MFETILNSVKELKKPKTADIRKLGKSYKKALKEMPLSEVFELVEKLLQVDDFMHTTIAYQLLRDQATRFEKDHFKELNHIITTYIHDWWDCDDVFTHAMATYFLAYPDMLKHIKEWTKHERFGVRRSAAVALIVPARKHIIPFSMIEEICDILFDDEHYLVLKGYGWLLKEASINYHEEVVAYVTKHVQTMPRTSFRYALEKLPEDERKQLMNL